MGVLREIMDVVKDASRFYELKMLHWIIRLHQPLDVGPPTYTWCQTCSQPWPCKEFMSASDQIDALTSQQS